MRCLNKILLSSVLAVFILLAQSAQAETITQTTSSEQPIEIEERWVSAMEDIQQGHYDRAIPVLYEYLGGDIVYNMAAKVKLGEIYFLQGLSKTNTAKTEKLRLSYKWTREAYTQGMATGFLPQEDGPLENGFLPHRLGNLCELGAGNEQIDSNIDDATCAIHWFKLAAEEGHALSMARLGYIYFDGLYEAEKDIDLALSYFRSALDRPEFQKSELRPKTSLAIAILILGQRGIEEPMENAVLYLKTASENGLPYAEYLLGTLYEHGLLGLTRDANRAAFLKNEASLSLTSAEITYLERMISKTQPSEAHRRKE